MWKTILLLTISNAFMTYAWYGHLKDHRAKAMPVVILLSWGIAFFEYCFMVPANRIGAEHLSLPQLKVLQEVITMSVFALFAIFYFQTPLTKNFAYAGICLIAAVYFIFRDTLPNHTP
jgi:uncharacterized protein (DUF486 family)